MHNKNSEGLGISFLPPGISALTSLTVLLCSCHKLTELPTSFGEAGGGGKAHACSIWGGSSSHTPLVMRQPEPPPLPNPSVPREPQKGRLLWESFQEASELFASCTR